MILWSVVDYTNPLSKPAFVGEFDQCTEFIFAHKHRWLMIRKAEGEEMPTSKWYAIDWFGGVKIECEGCHRYATEWTKQSSRMALRRMVVGTSNCPVCAIECTSKTMAFHCSVCKAEHLSEETIQYGISFFEVPDTLANKKINGAFALICAKGCHIKECSTCNGTKRLDKKGKGIVDPDCPDCYVDEAPKLLGAEIFPGVFSVPTKKVYTEPSVDEHAAITKHIDVQHCPKNLIVELHYGKKKHSFLARSIPELVDQMVCFFNDVWFVQPHSTDIINGVIQSLEEQRKNPDAFPNCLIFLDEKFNPVDIGDYIKRFPRGE